MANFRYQALGPLKSGEGSRAFLGLALVDQAPPRPVVLVWASNEATRDTEQIHALKAETDRAAMLDHPNIVKVFGLAQLSQGYARVVEYGDGETLRRILEAATKLPPALAALVVADVARGVHFAHLAGNDDGTPMLHGDIRPETVLVTFGGVSKITGYGALGVAPREGDGRRVVHRRMYAAPEQIVGGRGAASIHTDVYLLGLLLYECLTGRGPLPEQRLVLDVPEIPLALVPVLQKATAQKAYDRYSGAQAFREAVERAMGGLPLASEFAQVLVNLWPKGNPARLERQEMLKAGLREFGHDESVADKFSERTPPPTLIPPMARARAGREIQPIEDLGEESAPRPVPKRRGVPLWVFMLISLGLGALYVRFGEEWQPKVLAWVTGGVPAAAALPVAPPVVPVPAIDAGPSADAATEATPEARDESTAAALPAEEPPPAPLTKPSKGPGSLALVVKPPVDVWIDGKGVGRTPVSIPLAPGKHKLLLVEKALGIRDTRFVTIEAGRELTQRIVFRQGTITVAAPSGAVILLDGRQIGTTSIKDFPVYQGSHNILVRAGGANWRQGFELAADESLRFAVELQPR